MMKNILVTQPALPPLDEFVELLKDIWDSKWLTNNGKYHQQLEAALAEYLGVKYVSLFTNGTLALISALQVLRITGEVITTPYTFVATTHSLHWNGIKPVFVDVDPVYGNLDPTKIEAAITPKTIAIVPVHVYGNPAEVEKIQEIADTYGLKVIYDAAHAFGVNYKGHSILNFGDLSILSFHATKVYNTIEGGAIICHDEKTKKRIDYLKNFGFAGETTVIAPGINAKMNEVQAAYGLLQLKYLKENIRKRKEVADIYDRELDNIKGIRTLKQHPNATHNYPYYPIFIDEKEYGKTRDELYDYLKANNIFGRRYFYPLVSEFPMYKGLDSAKPSNLPNAHKKAEQVICLPIYPDLESDKLEEIIQIIKDFKG
ncbi:MAG: DegT/DnrJ/EryC1/StrS family aminotransferase [Prolixibacteraceae bacterium]|jgi:dTDP-4-amino-4,6-dideoxygalactose transaminase|nr:DegT/DnrJ/EryC1/StrS family aminotransferase [Prolixibacteraceae bacterium]